MFRNYFSCTATVKLLQSLHLFQINLLNFITDMPSLNRKEKVENCGTQTTRLNLACHKKVVLLGDCILPSVPISLQSF